MDRINTILVAVMLMICTGAKAETAEELGMTMDAHTWCKNIVAGWNLGNSLESSGGSWDNTNWNYGTTASVDWETYWGNPKTTKAMIDAVKAAGFNAIRIPVLWWPHIDDYSTMTINAAWLARVKEIVDWCIEDDMYVIINTHHEKWLESNPTYANQTKINNYLALLWTNIATAFKDYDEHLAFAGTNETTINWANPSDENLAVQHSYLQTFIDAVRATGGKNYYRNLIVQTYACNHDYGISGFTIPTDVVEGRLSVEFHYYQPWDYAGACSYYYWGQKYSSYGSIPSSDETTMTNFFNTVQSKYWDKGYGVVVGEYGVTNHLTGTSDQQAVQKENMTYFLKTMVSLMRQHGYAGFVWDNNQFGSGSEQFGIFRRTSGMSVGNTYTLQGILDGAGVEYNPSASSSSNSDDTSSWGTDYTGTTLWSGSAALNWGSGLQLKIEASEFAGLTEGAQIVLYYTLDSSADYAMAQYFYGDWNQSDKPQLICNGDTNNEFDLWTITGSRSGDQVTSFTIPAATLATLQSKGLILQGYGATLVKVLLVPVIAGDVNRNGRLSIEDVVCGIKLMNDGKTSTNADTDNDGSVTKTDIETIVNKVLGK